MDVRLCLLSTLAVLDYFYGRNMKVSHDENFIKNRKETNHPIESVFFREVSGTSQK